MAQKLTIRQIISRMRESEAKARDQAVTLIKQIHQSGPVQSWESEAQMRKEVGYPKIVDEALNLHVPAKGTAAFKGWYRSGQKRGMPSKTLLYAKENLAFKRYTDEIALAFPEDEQMAILGKRSGRARVTSSAIPKIIELEKELIRRQVPKHQRAHRISVKLSLNAVYVRKILFHVNKKSDI